jgi:hypothetical protein
VKRLALAIALVLAAPSAARANLVGAHCIMPGICTTGSDYVSPLSATFTLGGVCSAGPRARAGITPVYIVWYNASAPLAWTAIQKQQMLDFLTSIQAGAWWQNLLNYPANVVNNQNNIGPISTGLTIPNPCNAATCYDDDFESQGNVMNAHTGLGGFTDGTDIQIVSHAISVGGLTSSTSAIYLVLPSSNDITMAPAQGWHQTQFGGALGGVGLVMVLNTATAATAFNGNIGRGIPAYVTAHEFSEAVSQSCNGWFVGSAACGGGSVEIADACSSPACQADGWIGSGYFLAGGFLSNYSYTSMATTYFTQLPATWHDTEGGYCDTTNWPIMITQVCHSAADCPAFSGNCGIYTPFSSSSPYPYKRCIPPTCGDGLKNGNETDVDCGAWCYHSIGSPSTNRQCAAGKACIVPLDCVTNLCTASVCQQGGPGAACFTGADCLSGVCVANACT